MNTEEIKVLADLARLELTASEIDSYQKDFEGVLDYISTINNVDVEGFDDHVRSHTTNMMREDADFYPSGHFTEDLLNSAPERSDDYIKVQKVL